MPASTLPPDQGRSLAQLVARVERLERRTVTPNIDNWVRLTSGILCTDSASGSVSVTFPVRFSMLPNDFYGARAIGTVAPSITNWLVLVASYTTSGGLYTGATFNFSITQTTGYTTLLEWYLEGPIG